MKVSLMATLIWNDAFELQISGMCVEESECRNADKKCCLVRGWLSSGVLCNTLLGLLQ